MNSQGESRHWSCQALLLSLVLLLVAFPLLGQMARPLLRIAIVAAVLLAGVLAVDANRRHVRNAILLTVAQMVFVIVAMLSVEGATAFQWAVSSACIAMAALIIYAIVCVLSFVLRARVITRDQVYAGVSAYFLIGFAFGAVFYLLNILKPDSFAVNTPRLAETGPADLIYFSFVTLATLGYGDITPAAPLARSLSLLEAVSGTLYMAVFIARLVSQYGGRPEAN